MLALRPTVVGSLHDPGPRRVIQTISRLRDMCTQSPKVSSAVLSELCMVLGIAQHHEALADVLAATSMAGPDGYAVVQCQAEVSSKTRVCHIGTGASLMPL